MTFNSKTLVSKIFLARLEVVYSAPQPALIGGKQNPAYKILWDEYVQTLLGFSEEVLNRGWIKLRATWQRRTWPTPAECLALCVEASRELAEERAREEQASRPKVTADRKTPQEPWTDERLASHEAKMRRYHQAVGFDPNGTMTEKEWQGWFHDGRLPGRFAEAGSDAIVATEEPTTCKAPTGRPYGDLARRLVGRIDAARREAHGSNPSLSQGIINAHWQSCSDELRRTLSQRQWELICDLRAEYDDGAVLMVSVGSADRKGRVERHCRNAVEAVIGRRFLVGLHPQRKFSSSFDRIEFFEQLVRERTAGEYVVEAKSQARL